VIYGLGALPALATAAGVTTLLPESPRWLLLRGGGKASAREKALGALTRLRGTYAASFFPSFTMSSNATRAFDLHCECERTAGAWGRSLQLMGHRPKRPIRRSTILRRNLFSGHTVAGCVVARQTARRNRRLVEPAK
jgi:hypothetical protein